jgi:hypothetical protein
LAASFDDYSADDDMSHHTLDSSVVSLNFNAYDKHQLDVQSSKSKLKLMAMSDDYSSSSAQRPILSSQQLSLREEKKEDEKFKSANNRAKLQRFNTTVEGGAARLPIPEYDYSLSSQEILYKSNEQFDFKQYVQDWIKPYSGSETMVNSGAATNDHVRDDRISADLQKVIIKMNTKRAMIERLKSKGKESKKCRFLLHSL